MKSKLPQTADECLEFAMSKSRCDRYFSAIIRVVTMAFIWLLPFVALYASLRTPDPEPAVWHLLGVWLVVLGWRKVLVD
jgi:hypothetical protein